MKNSKERRETPHSQSRESTDITLFVQTSGEELEGWDRNRIFDALVRETDINEELAQVVATEVEKMVSKLEVGVITAPLVRELTNAKLVEYGLAHYRKQHTRLGVPLYDARKIITEPNRENANVPHGPEATNLTLAETIKKEYALLEVFTEDLANAHMSGDIHLHDLGMVDRPYCSGQNLEYVKRFGLNLPNALSIAKPAKHPDVLIEHIIKFSAALQGHYAGAIGWDAVNLFLAPYLRGKTHAELKQLAQILVFEFAQQAVARGGQSIFSDLNLYWEIPEHFRTVEAVGPKGQFMGVTYEDFLPESQAFVKALFEVYLEGDAMGRPFFFPKPNVHMTDKFFSSEGHEEFLQLISKVASEKGNTYFVFDRGNTAKIAECCRLQFELNQDDLDDAKQPWRMRYSAMQNVTINLPRIAYEANQNDTRLKEILTQRIELAAKAHLQKREFIARLLSMGKYGPLSLLTMNLDGEPYYRLNKASFLVGMVGLNEMVQYHTGNELHESPDATMFGLEMIAHMKKEAERIGKENGIKMPLEQTPAESTAHRFAKLDMKHHPLKATMVVKGGKQAGEIYYTNSTYLNVGADINPIKRVKDEGKFHPLIDAGALTHVWLGESQPDPESIANFVRKVHRETVNTQVAFSPEFTSCLSCGRTVRGLSPKCTFCGSEDVEGITRVTGFFSKVSSWNKGKKGELKDRTRVRI